jgi:hypothetical protein
VTGKWTVRVVLQLTVGWSASPSWLRAPSGTHDQIFALVRTVVVLSVVGRPPRRDDDDECVCCNRSQSLC